MRVRAVIFDVDGTLVDSNDAHARAWAEALAEHGHHVDVARIRPLIGMGGDKLLPKLTGVDPESAEGRKISDRRRAILLGRYVPHLKRTRGAKQLLERLHAEGLRLYVATSAKREELDPLLRITGGDSLFEQTTSSDDAENSKPDPDIVSAALKQTGGPPEDAIMIGDTPYDVEAARRAGVRVIALRCGGWDADNLRGADGIYNDPQDLADHSGWRC